MTPEGHPARSDPGQIVGPDTLIVHQEAGYIDAALHLLVHRVTHRRCPEGWVHI